MENRLRILEAMLMMERPITAREAAQLANMDQADADKALEELLADGAIVSPEEGKWEAINGTQ